MTAVAIEITEPADGAVVLGRVTSTLKGRVTSAPEELPGVPLHFRWYSSLFPATEMRISINEIALADPATPFTTTLDFGRNALTLAASDKADEATLKDTVHGGVAGGAEGPGRRVVTVVVANLLVPLAGATLSRAVDKLEAEAPRRAAGEKHAEADRLRYRWRFVPTPADGRGSGEIAGPPLKSDPPAEAAKLKALEFLPGATPPTVRYAGALPAALGLGAYALTLRVEAADAPTQGLEVTRQVVIAA